MKNKTLAVIGAGSMGSGIAAHMANAGYNVVLLDIKKEFAEGGVERQIKQRGFYDPAFAERITTGTIEENLDLIAEAEWIVEAIIENVDAKRELYAKLAQHRKPGAFVTSNTSTIPLATLIEGRDEEFAAHFAITHFFNPPRIMRLVELVTPPHMDKDGVEKLSAILRDDLGKHVLVCRDTPGFIANRVGNYWMSVAANVALDNKLDPELADAAFSKPVGVPRTGIFGLFDYIGLQVVPPIWTTLLAALEEDDAFHKYADFPTTNPLKWLLDNGLTGRTGPSGFYRGRTEVLDYESLEYRPRKEVTDPVAKARGIAQAVEVDSVGGRYVWEVFAETLDYCCTVGEEIAANVADIDAGLEYGYSWKQGPFAMADAIGVDKVAERFAADGREIPALLNAAQDAGSFYQEETLLGTDGSRVPKPASPVTVTELVDGAEELYSNPGATIYKLEDGTGIFAMTSPMNSCTLDVLTALEEVVSFDLKALVIANDQPNVFSAGADLNLIAGLAAEGDVEGAAEVIRKGNLAFRRLRTAPFPVVGAARGIALGGGTELSLHTDRMVAHAELRLGLPERQVGLFPSWNGLTRLLERHLAAGTQNAHKVVYDYVMACRNTDNAVDARKKLVLREDDVIVMNPDEVLSIALEQARALAEGYEPVKEQDLALSGADASAFTVDWSGEDVAEADRDIAVALANVFSGEGTISPDDLAEREITEAAKVVVKPKNAARTAHMAKYRRPLKDS